MKQLLVLSGLLLSIAASGQTYFYIDDISVDPAAPTTADNISIDLTGNLSSTGAFVASTGASVTGNVITLTVNSADPGGLAVLVPHTENMPIGQLPAGVYTIVITGTATGDFAPQPQHSFTVIGGGNLPACDSLVIYSILYGAFNDSTIEVVVSNPSSVLFDYPGFILFDGNGDTLAIETVDYFGIGTGPQVHTLVIHPDATFPAGVFTGTLELWTSFTTDLACNFPVTLDLCPPGPCQNVVVSIGNMGGALVVSGFTWTITDSLGTTVGTGVLQLGNSQSDTANICLPPGNYTLTMVQPNITGGQLFYGVGDALGAVIQEPFIQGGATNELPFPFYPLCIDAGTSIAPLGNDPGMLIVLDNGSLNVTAKTDLGLLRLHDAQGRIVLEQRVAGNSARIDVQHLASGCYLLVQPQGNANSVRFVKP
ncbi:MAG: hypothetical protein WAU70_10485 [Flavobacteriales bacterium]